MLESQRVDILQAMGLKTLQPRFQLDAAKPSAVLTVVADNTALVSDHSVQASADADTASPAVIPVAGTLVEQAAELLRQQQMQDVTGQLATAEAATAAQPQAVSVSSVLDAAPADTNDATVATAKDKPLKFRQRLLRCGESLMVVDQPALQWQDEKNARIFFEDIYFSLYKKRAEFYASDVFEWPPAKNFVNAQDITAARATFSGFLQSKLQYPPCEWLICWGENATRYLIEDDYQLGKICDFQGRKLLMADDLISYWQNPQSKRLLWDYLQTLHASLADD